MSTTPGDSSGSVHNLLTGLLGATPVRPGRLARLLPTSGTLHGLSDRCKDSKGLSNLLALLRGLGQVIFINNPVSGFVLLLALVLQAPAMAALAALGITAAHLFARRLGCEEPALRNGIYGFNGALVGCAVAAFAQLGGAAALLAWGLVVVAGAGLTTLLVEILGRRLLGRLGLPPLTLPFCLVSWLALGTARLAGHPAFPLQDPAPLLQAEGPLQALLLALPRGFGQVFLCPGLATGALVLLAVALASPLAALLGLIGAAGGALTGLLLQGGSDAVGMGLWSYNGVLTAIAVGGTFYAPTRRSVLLALVAAALSAAITPLLAGWFPPALPVLTLPFIVATLATLLVVRHALPALIPVALHSILTPEEHRRRFRVARSLLADLRRQLAAPGTRSPVLRLAAGADPVLLERIGALFHQLDHDRNGELSVAELASGLLRQGEGSLAEMANRSRFQQLAMVLEAMDLDRNGSVDATEFSELMLRLHRLSEGHDRLMRYLLPVDGNGDNRLDPLEINRLLVSVGQPALSAAESRRLFGAREAGLTWAEFIDRLLLA